MSDEMRKTTDDSSMHIVIFPWLAFGHMLPTLKLAERLASRGHRISFVSTPRNISRLSPRLPPSLAPLFSFVPLPLPPVDGLPDGAEATSDIPPAKAHLHLKAFDGLAAPFASFLDATHKIDWLIIDTFQYWAAEAAEARRIPYGMNLTFMAATLVRYGVPSTPAAAAQALAQGLPLSIQQRFALTFQACRFLTYRSCGEMEPESTPLLPAIFGNKPVIPVGLLPPSPDPSPSGARDTDRAAAQQLAWLDQQPPNSVVYAAFGSEAPLTVEQLHEMAHGLDLAGAAFLWALRKLPPATDNDDDDDDPVLLPPGFEERTRGRGIVTMGWVPQLDILAHPAVGAFFTHCGCSSVIEAVLFFGKPLIMLPFLGEQAVNARLMEAKQVGVRVPRSPTTSTHALALGDYHDDDTGSFDRLAVAASVRAVLSMSPPEEQGGGVSVFAANAKKLRDLMAHKNCHEGHIDQFARFLTTSSYKDKEAEYAE